MPVLDKIKAAFSSSSSSSEKTKDAAPTSTSSAQPSAAPPASDKLPELSDEAVFSPEKITVIFVLGGPGAGEFRLYTLWPDCHLHLRASRDNSAGTCTGGWLMDS